MRKILIVAAVAMAGVANAQPSKAEAVGRWCANMDIGSGSVSSRCDFMAFRACRRFVNAQPKSVCNQNPRYIGNWIGEDTPEYSAFRRYD